MPTDEDNIELPPLPMAIDTSEVMRDYARAAVRYDRERRAKVEVKPVVHSRTLRLTDAGHVYRKYENASPTVVATVKLCWTDDGRAWIESERNQMLASFLRQYGHWEAADALDGGER